MVSLHFNVAPSSSGTCRFKESTVLRFADITTKESNSSTIEITFLQTKKNLHIAGFVSLFNVAPSSLYRMTRTSDTCRVKESTVHCFADNNTEEPSGLII